jgi:hypothetical protein
MRGALSAAINAQTDEHRVVMDALTATNATRDSAKKL